MPLKSPEMSSETQKQSILEIVKNINKKRAVFAWQQFLKRCIAPNWQDRRKILEEDLKQTAKKLIPIS